MLGLGLVRAARTAGADLRCALLRLALRVLRCVARYWAARHGMLVLRSRDGARCWCCACGVVRFPAGWFVVGVLQAAGEENKFWKIRDFVNSKFLKNFFFVMNHFKTPKISEVLF